MSIPLAPRVSSITPEEFLSTYRAGLNPSSFETFHPFQFQGSFGSENLHDKALDGRVEQYGWYSTYALCAIIISALFVGIFLHLETLSLLAISVCCLAFVYLRLQIKQLTSVALLASDCTNKDNPEYIADALIGAGPKILQRSWSCGAIEQTLLELARDTINLMGQALASKQLQEFERLKVIFVQRLKV